MIRKSLKYGLIYLLASFIFIMLIKNTFGSCIEESKNFKTNCDKVLEKEKTILEKEICPRLAKKNIILRDFCVFIVMNINIFIFAILVWLFQFRIQNKEEKEEKEKVLLTPKWKMVDIMAIYLLPIWSWTMMFLLLNRANINISSSIYEELMSLFFTLMWFIGVYFIVIKRYKPSFKELGLNFGETNIIYIVLGQAIGIGFACLLYLQKEIVYVLAKMFGWTTNVFFVFASVGKEPINPIYYDHYVALEPLEVPFYCFRSIILAPIIAEIFFRGIVYSFLRNKIGIIPSIFISSLLFTMAYSEFIFYLGYFLVGVCFAYLYEKKGSIIPCIIAHHVINLIRV